MKAGKIWGKTELIHANGVLEFHRIEYKKDVQEGLIDETILNAGDFTRVKPGLFHEFIGLEDGVAFELYWAEFDHNDIERESQGHKVNEKVTINSDVNTAHMTESFLVEGI
jgi:hypothetical protein